MEQNFALPTTTQQSTFGGHGRAVRASQCLAHLEYIHVGEQKAPGTCPGVESGCLSVSSQGVGPGLDQEWGKGGSIKGSQIVLESKQRGCQQWNLQVGVPKWPEMAAP